MNASNDNTAAGGFRGWWQDPPRAGMRRLINPVAYRHPRAFGTAHLAGGTVAAVAGAICLGYRVYGWAAFFLVIAGLNVGGGAWYLRIARSRSGPA
jgi:hypothetical protein